MIIQKHNVHTHTCTYNTCLTHAQSQVHTTVYACIYTYIYLCICMLTLKNIHMGNHKLIKINAFKYINMYMYLSILICILI